MIDGVRSGMLLEVPRMCGKREGDTIIYSKVLLSVLLNTGHEDRQKCSSLGASIPQIPRITMVTLDYWVWSLDLFSVTADCRGSRVRVSWHKI